MSYAEMSTRLSEMQIEAQRIIDSLPHFPRTDDFYGSLVKFRDRLKEQLYDCAEKQDFCKVAEIAWAINMITDLLNMPTIQDWKSENTLE